MGPLFPEECVLPREHRSVFLDTRFPGEYPCEGCPMGDCEIKLRLTAACVLGKDIEDDFHSIKCARCGARMYAWKIGLQARTWFCNAKVPDAYDNEFECGFTYTARVALAEW